MKQKKALRRLALVLFSALFLFSAYVILSYFREDQAQEAAFDELEALVDAAEDTPTPSSDQGSADTAEDMAGPDGTDTTAEEDTSQETAVCLPDNILPGYAALYQKNPDLFGWVEIPGTQLNYPVMYTPDDPEYYLRRAFDRSPSVRGVPFLDGNCPVDGGNYLLYGHNMSSGTMFAALHSYSKESFCKTHSTILFDTLFEKGEYQVMAAFYSEVYGANEQGAFRYYQYTDLRDPQRFQEYVTQVKAASLYDTGVTAEYGDQLLTLSTCSYQTDDGRFVVVARKEA